MNPTKGPWVISGSMGYGIGIRSAGDNPEWVAVVYGSIQNPNATDNAMLIASAPSMFRWIKQRAERGDLEAQEFLKLFYPHSK